MINYTAKDHKNLCMYLQNALKYSFNYTFSGHQTFSYCSNVAYSLFLQGKDGQQGAAGSAGVKGDKVKLSLRLLFILYVSALLCSVG